MRGGPSTRLERIVGAFIPPACREEVLGDLREKCIGSWQYIGLAIRVIPLVILSRIRRTSDLQLRLTEALIIYGSFFAAAWYNEPAALPHHDGLFRVTIPTAVNLIDLLFEDAWAGGSAWVLRLVRSVTLGIGIGFNIYGEFASVLLVFGLHIVMGSGTKFAHASGPRRGESVATTGALKSLLTASGAVVLAALFLVLAGRPVGRSTMAAIVVFVVVILFRRPRKE